MIHLGRWVLSPSSQERLSSSSGGRLRRLTSRTGRSPSTRTRTLWTESSPPKTEETRDEESRRPEGHASPVESGRTQGAESRSSQIAPRLKTTRAVRQEWSRSNCPRGPYPPRRRRSVASDEPSTLLVASRRDSSSDRVQGRPRRRARHQGQSRLDQQDLPSVWRSAPRYGRQGV